MEPRNYDTELTNKQ